MRVTIIIIIIIIMRVTIIIISFAMTFFVPLFVVVKEKMHFLSYFQPLKQGFQLTLDKRYAACFTKGLKRSTPHLELQVWSQSNTLVYCFTLATTIGYGHLTPTDPSE